MVKTGVAFGAMGALGGCSLKDGPTSPGSSGTGSRLNFVPPPGGPTKTVAKGTVGLGIGDSNRDAILYLPQSYDPAKPIPLTVLLHGAGGSAEAFYPDYVATADSLGMALLAIDSYAYTWDAILGEFGNDVTFIKGALDWTFDRVNVDRAHFSLYGFSDGATYSLALGRANGDVFRKLGAASPGFLLPHGVVGVPPIFITHGTNDTVLPIDMCSRKIVPQLRSDGYDVTYKEFAGGHTVLGTLRLEMFTWFAA